jgi:hypothetical protein
MMNENWLKSLPTQHSEIAIRMRRCGVMFNTWCQRTCRGQPFFSFQGVRIKPIGFKVNNPGDFDSLVDDDDDDDDDDDEVEFDITSVDNDDEQSDEN